MSSNVSDEHKKKYMDIWSYLTQDKITILFLFAQISQTVRCYNI